VDALLDFAANGLLGATWWQVLLVTLALTHVTIVSVTLYLHRAQAHRALDLHPLVAHFFRFWLWLTTGMVTHEWVAIHRKHHAKCETADDPHSPVTRGLSTVLARGAELYRSEAANAETLRRYSHGTPDDALERRLYSRYPVLGVSLMMVIDLALFGALGLTVWAVQMAWIPIWAAGVINGLGHAWGYRNFEAPDASTNISPWGLLIGGEELHNNHHTYPTSAKFSVKRFEFDLGWAYIRVLAALRLAAPRKTPPRLVMGDAKTQADESLLQAVIAHRYELMARYARDLRAACAQEMVHFRHRATATDWRLAQRWLHRDAEQVPSHLRARLDAFVSAHPGLRQWVEMREELRRLWTSTNVSAEQLVHDLQDWCHRAEASGTPRLSAFAQQLRMARAA